MKLVFTSLLFLSITAFGQINYPYITKHTDDVSSLAFSPDNSFIVSGGWDSKLIVYSNDSTYNVHQELKDFHGAVKSIAFSRDGYKMIAGGQEGKLAIYGFNDLSSWDIIGLDTFLELNRAQINQLIYGPGMRMIFSACDDGKFLSYDLTKKKTMMIDTKRPISAACVSVDRRSFYIANEDNPNIVQYDLFGKVMRTLEGHLNDVTDLVVTPNRKFLISASKDRSIRVWNIASGKVERTITEHTWAVTDLSMDPYGKLIASCGLDGNIVLFEIETGKKIMEASLPRQRCNAIALSPDLTKIAVATTNTAMPESNGFYVIPTPLKARTVRTAKRYFVDKDEEALHKAIHEADEEEMKLREEAKNAKTTAPVKKDQPKAAPKTKTIKKTEQLEIKLED